MEFVVVLMEWVIHFLNISLKESYAIVGQEKIFSYLRCCGHRIANDKGKMMNKSLTPPQFLEAVLGTSPKLPKGHLGVSLY